MYYSARRPLIRLYMIVITAMTKRMWINPPTTGNIKNPSNHNTNKITAIVYNILSILSV